MSNPSGLTATEIVVNHDSDRTGPFWDMVEGRSPLSAASRLLGWTLLSLDPENGTIRVGFTATADFMNPFGIVQGGILTAMLDDAMGPVATAHLGGHHMAPTVELKTNFMRPAGAGRLFVDARVVHRGRNILFLEASMEDEQGRLIATATATTRVFDWPTTQRAA